MCLHIISCFCPPLAVLFKKGCGCDLCINCGLTCLGGIPGCCHACYVVSQEKAGSGTTVVINNQQQAYIPPPQPLTYIVTPPQTQGYYPPPSAPQGYCPPPSAPQAYGPPPPQYVETFKQ